MAKLLTTEQLSNQLQVSTQSIYNFKKQGMPSIKIGTVNRYDYEEVLKWMKEKEDNKQK